MLMQVLGAAMVAGCALHLVLVARAHDWHPLHVACPAVMLLAMVDTCLLGEGWVPGELWATLLVLAAAAALVFAPTGRTVGHSLGVVAVVATLLALPAAATAQPETTGMTGMTGMAGMHHAATGMHHAATAVPTPLWWAAVAAVVTIAVALTLRVAAPGARARRVLALVGLAEVGLMAAMVLPATA